MTSVPLGATGIQVSAVGVGAMTWADGWGGYYGGGYDLHDAQAAYRACREAGITLFDTAELYTFGRSERVVGAFVRQEGAARSGAVVATKFGPLPWRLRPTALRRALQASLRRFGLPRIDLYQMHWPGGPVAIERWMDAMADAVEAGLVGAVGVSNYDAAQMRRAHAALAKRGIPLASNQVQYSLLYRTPERDGVLDACRELGITPIAYSPLFMGVLTGKYTPDQRPRGLFRQFLPAMSSENLARIQPLIEDLREIGEANAGKSPGQAALAWLVAKGAVPINGVRNERHARELAGVLDWRLTDDEVARLDATSEAGEAR